jgi:AcrR family transcriptional regulator
MGRREDKKRETQNRILEVALPLFVEHGYIRCTIDDIARDANIARGTFYLYHNDKLSIFQSLIEKLYQPIINILDSALIDMEKDNNNTLTHQIRYIRTASELAQFIESKRHAIPLHFREIWAAGEQGKAIRYWRRQIEDLSTRLINASISHGLIRPVPSVLTSMAVVGATERIIWGWLHDELPSPRRQLAQDLAALFWQGIAPEPNETQSQ